MSTPDLAWLREVAEAATAGEWMAASDNKRKDGIALVGIASLRGQGGRGCIAVLAGSGDAINDRHANAQHIAAFDPPTALALLDEIERLRAVGCPSCVGHARIEALIERSSLGGTEAKSARESVPREIGSAIALAARYLGERDEARAIVARVLDR